MTDENLALTERKWTDVQLNKLRAVIAPRCDDTDIELLVAKAKFLELNPLLGEIWAVKYDQHKPASVFVGRDGYIKIALRDKNYAGFESGSKKEGDEIVGWCRVFRKDFTQPVYGEIYLSEYPAKSGSPMEKMPRTRAQKIAESQVFRKAFGVFGVYAEEEISGQEPAAPVEPKEVPVSEYPDHIPMEPARKPLKKVPVQKL